jgi:hypothetical protein
MDWRGYGPVVHNRYASAGQPEQPITLCQPTPEVLRLGFAKTLHLLPLRREIRNHGVEHRESVLGHTQSSVGVD